MLFDDLWVVKYAPKKLSEVVLEPEHRAIFEKFIKEESVPRLAFVGHPGTGKTTVAKVLVNEIDCQYLYINASDESGIDTIRNKVTGFAQTKSIDGKIKVIILDEADGLTADAQRSLRNTTETYAAITRFIITANYQHRLIDALKSRVDIYNFTPPLQGIIDRLKFILTQEKIKFTDTTVEEIARARYPDLRKAIGDLLRYSRTGTLVIPSKSEVSELVDNIFKLLKGGHVLKIRKWVIENETKFNTDYPELLRSLFNHVFEQKIDDDSKKRFLIIISEYLYRSSAVLDQEINFYSCIVQLSEKPL